MIVKLRKGQKYSKFLKSKKIEQNLAKIHVIKIVKTIYLSQETIPYPCFKSK